MVSSVKAKWLAVAMFLMNCSGVESVQAGKYTISAHGDASYGVYRTDLGLLGYSQGNCTHCHEQHASIDGIEQAPVNGGASPFNLFSKTFDTAAITKPYNQADVFCFYCHSTSGSLQQGGAMVNYDYAKTFGGASGGPTSIMDAFNQPGEIDGSYHNLYDIWDFARTEFDFFTDNSDPCSACHNPHLARRNKENKRDASYACISRPTEHSDQWGDDVDEQMSDYSAIYQAPFYFGSSSTYEPDAVSSSQDDGSLTPDYNTFCLDCHNQQVYSTTLSRNIVAIDWSASGGDLSGAGDKHGSNNATVDVVSRSPYGVLPGYVLSCLDCHEPHGSPNAYLIRRSINGESLGVTIDSGKDGSARGNQCRQCHKDDYEAGGSVNTGLINVWRTTHHGGGLAADNPYRTTQVPGCGCHEVVGNKKMPIACDNCHGHDKYVDATHPGTIDGRSIPAPYFTNGQGGYLRRTF
ncbi:MAG: cytochrome c3 family protein [Desulfobulbaceae bacterium]|nr:cytochrome c3 family protein [Desulfobulbaceae bacterium]